MNRWPLAQIVLLFLATLSTTRAADCELMLTGARAPTRARISVKLGERKFADVWTDNFAAITEFFDFDGDGKLSPAEAARLPSVQALREVLSTGFIPSFGTLPEFAELDANSDKFVAVNEVAAFYRQAGLGAPLVGAGHMSHTRALNATLMKLLDADVNGQVSEAELKTAPAAITKFDRNDDEMIGAGELVAGLRYPGGAGSYLLKVAQPDSKAETLRTKFAATLVPADDDQAADFVVAIRLPVADAAEKEAQAPLISAVVPADAKLQAGSLTLTKPGLQFVLRADAGKLPETAEGVYARLQRRFGDEDANDDATLDAAEIEKTSGTEWRNLLATADRNGDGQLAEAELQGWIKLQQQLAAGQVLLTLLDGGQGLFELLDVNRDGALSAAELRSAHQRVTAAGALQDGKLSFAQIPTTILITASQGYPQSVLGAAERSGPAWFLAMDRNLDGEVSRREFSGPAAAFTKLDANSDEVISENEAVAVK
jgi:Ca2+-binding EF-hand superfamily protein